MNTIFINLSFGCGCCNYTFIRCYGLLAFIRSPRLAKPPSTPARPFKCPACGSEQIDVFSVGFVGWCRFGWSRDWRITRRWHLQAFCSVHAQYLNSWDNDKKETCYETRKLTEEEWRRETEPA